MKGRNSRTVAAGVAVLVVACAPDGAVDREADREAIASMYAERSERMQGGSSLEDVLEAYMSVLPEDVVWMPQNSPPLVGKQAVESWARDFFARYSLDVDSLPMDILEIGTDLALRRWRSVGRYIPSDGSEPVPYDQKYVDCLRKTTDGSWQVVMHMWSSNNADPTIWDERP